MVVTQYFKDKPEFRVRIEWCIFCWYMECKKSFSVMFVLILWKYNAHIKVNLLTLFVCICENVRSTHTNVSPDKSSLYD